jgi:lipoate-protein ligase A
VSRDANRERQVEKLRESVTSVYEYTGVDISVTKMCHVLQKSFEKKLCIELVEGGLTAKEAALMARLIKDKYTNDQWNMEGKRTLHGY